MFTSDFEVALLNIKLLQSYYEFLATFSKCVWLHGFGGHVEGKGNEWVQLIKVKLTH